jgi:hypothetical protein
MTTTTPKRLDKRLRPAKVIGIILFILSIVGFAGNVVGGLMSLMFNNVFEHGPVFSDAMDWIFRHYSVLAFSFSIFWIPLFFSARALYRFKEWGRIVSILMLFLLMIFVAGMAYAFSNISFAPIIMRIFWIFAFSIYVAVLGVAVYFLARQSTREGIRDFKQGLLERQELCENQTS